MLLPHCNRMVGREREMRKRLNEADARFGAPFAMMTAIVWAPLVFTAAWKGLVHPLAAAGSAFAIPFLIGLMCALAHKHTR